MNHKKKLLTTSIIAILFGASQANDYISIISQEKHVYDVVENSLPVATNWVDVGSEFDCVKEFSEYDYPLGESFTQNENCLQKQERTVTTTEIFNGTPRTTIATDYQNTPVVISYIDTGKENFDTGQQKIEYTNWLNNGNHYNCNDFIPLPSTINLNESFNQNRNCSQDQDRIKTVYNIWADNSEILSSTEIENKTLIEIESQNAIGTKNFITNEQRIEYSEWTDLGGYHSCETFLPIVSSIGFNESFNQNRNCSQDQQRVKTTYNIWADTSESINKTDTENQTIIKNESKSAVGTSRNGYIILLKSTHSEVNNALDDVNNTGSVNWDEKFGKTYDIVLNEVGMANELIDKTGVIDWFNPDKIQELIFSEGCSGGDLASADIEYLDQNNNVVFWLRTRPYGTYGLYLNYGTESNFGGAINPGITGPYPALIGDLSFNKNTNTINYNRKNTTNYVNNWQINNVDVSSITKIKLVYSNVKTVYTGATCGAQVRVRIKS